MSNGKKLIRIGGRLIEVPLGEASQKKSQAAKPAATPPTPVETSAPEPVSEAPAAPPVEAVEEPAKKPRRRRKPRTEGTES